MSRFPELDIVLFKWITQQHIEGKPLFGPSVMKKAKQFFDFMETEEPCKFSVRWLDHFKDRHDICKLVIAGEMCSADNESAF